MASHAGPHEEAPGLVRRQKEQEENTGMSLYHRFCRKKWARQGKKA